MPLHCSLITVSSTRSLESDEPGRLMAELLVRGGHEIVERTLVSHDPGKIALVLRHWLGSAAVKVLIVAIDSDGEPRRPIGSAGGGESAADVARRFVDQELEGFSAIFRWRLFQEAGVSAIFADALAGRARDKLLFVLPGSTSSVRLGIEELVLPSLSWLESQRLI